MQFLDKYNDYGLLLLRVGIGLIFVLIHGRPKITGGTQAWENLGESMAIFGITFAPVFWGLMAALSEFVGGLCLITGFLFRPACLFMMFTMMVALLTGFYDGHGLAAHPLTLFILFLSLSIIGAGKLTLPELFRRSRAKINQPTMKNQTSIDTDKGGDEA